MSRPTIQTLYKLTDASMQTRGGYRWVLGKRRQIAAEHRRPDAPLCSGSYLHAYLTPELARLLNPVHANFEAPRLFEARGAIVARDGVLKVGVYSLTLTRELPYVASTTEQAVTFAIACVWPLASPAWRTWARRWLTGEDRSRAAAAAAEAAAWAAARAEAAWAEARAEARAEATGDTHVLTAAERALRDDPATVLAWLETLEVK